MMRNMARLRFHLPSSLFSPSGLPRPWRVLALVLLVLNVKNLPFVWHYRVWSALIYHFALRPVRFTKDTGPRALFKHVVTRSWNPMMECDWNLHKSNSTYQSDIDVSRAHLLGVLIQHGLKTFSRTPLPSSSSTAGKPVKAFPVLGGTTCSFKREIKPYQAFEMWSRILAWDEKWLYVVTHLVEVGRVRPRGFVVGSEEKGVWSWMMAMAGGKTRPTQKSPTHEPNGTVPLQSPRQPNGTLSPTKSPIFASALSRYCIKKGRLTIPPAHVLDASGLLPAKPTDADPSSLAAPSSSSELTPDPRDPGVIAPEGSWVAADVGGEILAPRLGEKGDDTPQSEGLIEGDEEWTYDRVERERKKGMEMARLMAGLEGLHGLFPPGEGERDGVALRMCRDLF